MEREGKIERENGKRERYNDEIECT